MTSEPQPDGETGTDATEGERNAEAGGRVGGMLGRLARRARPEAERLAERARPEAERLAQRARDLGGHAAREARPEAERLAQVARAAVEAGRPHLERAGRGALQFARDHDDEIRRAARTGAEFTVRRAIPLPLQPIVHAVEGDLRRRPPLRDDRTPDLDGSVDGPGDADTERLHEDGPPAQP
ncbi:MAG: hypothetical protein WD058_05925 [Dehalococcoidia bacterium]